LRYFRISPNLSKGEGLSPPLGDLGGLENQDSENLVQFEMVVQTSPNLSKGEGLSPFGGFRGSEIAGVEKSLVSHGWNSGSVNHRWLEK
jgi:hypothetical protein